MKTSSLICLLLSTLALLFGQQSPRQSESLRDLLNRNRIHPPDDVAHLDRKLSGYAYHDAESRFLIAYDLDDGTGSVPEWMHLAVLEKRDGTWLRKDYERSRLAADESAGKIPGSLSRVKPLGRFLAVETHKTPSASVSIVLDENLEWAGSVYGWFVASFESGLSVFQHGQIHFAPTHYVELSLYDPSSRRTRRLYPLEPYQEVRLRHRQKIEAAYRIRGEDWFRNHNHHMDPDKFPNHLEGDVAWDDAGRTLAFVLAYDNKEYWSEEQKLKAVAFADLHRYTRRERDALSVDDLSLYLAADLGRIRRMNSGNSLLQLLDNDAYIREIFAKALDTERRPNERASDFLRRADGTWGNMSTWQRFLRWCETPPEFTSVLHVYTGVSIDAPPRYREILWSDFREKFKVESVRDALRRDILEDLFCR